MIAPMWPTNLQDLCERGQIELMETRYLDAAKTFETAEAEAWQIQDFDTLSRLYLPLQEARRQIRQRCSEGITRPYACPYEPSFPFNPQETLKKYNQGQLLLAWWGS